MNERIKELAQNAGIETEFDDYGEVRLSMAYGSTLEKFAELMVRECADIATNRYQRLMDGGKAIKEHFGVE